MHQTMCLCCGAFRPPRIPFIRISEADHGRAAHPCSTECTRRVPLLAPAGTPALLVRYPGPAHPFVGARHRPAPQLGHAQRTGLLRSHGPRSEEHTSELQSPCNLVCRLLLEKKKKKQHCTCHSNTTRHTTTRRR